MEPEIPTRRAAILHDLRELAQTLVMALVLYAVLTTFIGRYEVLNISMEPTFHQGQRIIVNRSERLLPPWLTRVAYAHDGSAQSPSILKHDEVAVFYPTDDHKSTPLIKRVIGLPGDRISIRDNQVWVNGQRLDEPYIHGLPTSCSDYCDLQLQPGQYFMMGDNRTNSLDSRVFGPVKETDILGNVVLRYWPLDQVQVFP